MDLSSPSFATALGRFADIGGKTCGIMSASFPGNRETNRAYQMSVRFMKAERSVHFIVAISIVAMPGVTTAQPAITVIDQGVAFEVAARVISAEGGRGVEVIVRVQSVDGGSHGMLREPLRYEARIGGLGEEPTERFSQRQYWYGGSWPVIVSPGVDAAFLRVFTGRRTKGLIVAGQWLELAVGISALETLSRVSPASPDLAIVRLEIDARGWPKLWVLPPRTTSTTE